MAKEYSPLKLIKNTVYPSYQLYTTAESSKLSTDEVFKVCILETLFWIRQKFENLEIPEELKSPAPSQYENFSLNDLKTFRIECGYIVDVVYVKSKKIWSFQLVEPDLAATVRLPVPGRVFTTDISFSIENNIVKCAFRTLVSEPENCKDGIVSLRNGVIKRLVRNSHIKLFHDSLQLNEKPIILNSEIKIKKLKDNINSKKRTLPLIIFAEYKKGVESNTEVVNNNIDIESLKKSAEKSLLATPFSTALARKITDVNIELSGYEQKSRKISIKHEAKTSKIAPKNVIPKKQDEASTNNTEYLYELNDIAVDFMGYAVIYGLSYNKIAYFSNLLKVEISPGDILVLEAQQYGNKIIYKYTDNTESNLKSIKELKNSYHIKKFVDFDNYSFVRDARIIQQREMLANCNTIEEIVSVCSELNKELETMKSSVKELNEYKSLAIQYENKLETANANLEKLKQKFTKQKENLEKEIINKSNSEKKLQIQVEYYRSLDSRPKIPKELPAWIRKEFPESIVLHKKASDMLEKMVSFPDGYMKKLCDALEYLGREYFMYYYSKEISRETASLYASLKYNQEFIITPSSDVSIKFLPSDYKIKFDKNDGNGRKEYPLNLHLKSGTDPEHLIRIYFHYDEYNKKIVIGSLPKHLPTVSQR